MIDFSNIRRSFSKEETLLKKELFHKNPMEECILWLRTVEEKKLEDGNAMTLSTSTKSGDVSSRTVLLKYLDHRGFSFFTNYNSRKAKDILENPKVSITFYWPSLNRQIIASGTCEKLSFEETERYFNSRPRLNQLQAKASNQDEEIESMEVVLKKIEEIDQKYHNQPLPTPAHWGGFLIRPQMVEFWQGTQGRLNLRFRYTLENGIWQIRQLSP